MLPYIMMRLLDPTPLSDEEVNEQVSWGWIEDSETFINYHHPLYVGHHADPPEEANEELKRMFNLHEKFKAKHQYIHRDGTPKIWMFERAYRPLAAQILVQTGLHQDSPHELAEFIVDLWTDTEFPFRNESWKVLFNKFPDLDGPIGDVDLLDQSGSTRVYRGIALPAGSEVDPDLGYSWTTDHERAEWFAHRFASLEEHERPIVLVGQVDNDKVMFATNARGENEVVSKEVTLTDVKPLSRSVA